MLNKTRWLLGSYIVLLFICYLFVLLVATISVLHSKFYYSRGRESFDKTSTFGSKAKMDAFVKQKPAKLGLVSSQHNYAYYGIYVHASRCIFLRVKTIVKTDTFGS